MSDFSYFCHRMETKSTALVLRSLRYGESQMIVDLFTRELGRVSFICHLPKSSRGRTKKQLFQPLTLLAVSFDYRPRLSLQHFRDIRLWKPYGSIPFDALKLSVSLFVAEFLCYALRDEQRNTPLFDYLSSSMEWLDSAIGPIANFHLVLMMRLTRFIGFFPNLESYCDGAWFDLRGGMFTLTPPLHADRLEPREAALVCWLMRMDYRNMHLFRMSQAQRNRCTEVILYYYRLHVPSFPELKSLPVLQSLFA